MKWFAGLFSIIFASAGAFAADCTDFSGKYVWSGGSGYSALLGIHQTGCKKLAATYDYGGDEVVTRVMIFDGVKRPVQAGSKSLEGFLLKNDVILTDAELHADDEIFFSTGKIYLDSNKDLVEETIYFDHNGKQIAQGELKYVRK